MEFVLNFVMLIIDLFLQMNNILRKNRQMKKSEHPKSAA